MNGHGPHAPEDPGDQDGRGGGANNWAADYAEHEEDDEYARFDDFDRPFLIDAHTTTFGTPPRPASGDTAHDVDAADDEDDADEDQVRSYLLTGGRTGGGAAGIRMETTAVVTDVGLDLVHNGSLPFELGQVLDLCVMVRSVAEVSALVGIPLGVAQVLIADLVERNLLTTTTTSTALVQDVALLERLIAGVAAL